MRCYICNKEFGGLDVIGMLHIGRSGRIVCAAHLPKDPAQAVAANRVTQVLRRAKEPDEQF